MLALRSAKALQEKVLLKLHGIRKLPGSPSLGGTLFWIIAELSSIKKAAEICSIFMFVAYEFLEKFSIIRHSGQDIDKRIFGSSSSSSLSSKLIGFSGLVCLSFGFTGFGSVSFWVWLSVTRKGSRGSTRLLVSKSVELGFELKLDDFWLRFQVEF
ncbi:hypothetical protein Tco_0590411 [Tanacetum coccineum]